VLKVERMQLNRMSGKNENCCIDQTNKQLRGKNAVWLYKHMPFSANK